MVRNEFGHCIVCGCRLRLRFQAGFFNIPVSIYCPECQSHISGVIYLDGSCKDDFVQLFNYQRDEVQYPDGYVFELSTEFLTKKCRINDLNAIDLTPFLRNFGCNNIDNNYLRHLLVLSENVEQYITWIETLFHLLNDKKIQLVSKYIFSINEPRMTFIRRNIEETDLRSQLDAVMCAKEFVTTALSMIVNDKVFDRFSEIGREVAGFVSSKRKQFCYYFKYLEKSNYFKYFYDIIPAYICEFLRYIKEVLPILQKYDEYDSISLKEEGITTLSVLDIHHLYAKGYEVLCDSLDIFWGIYNILNFGEYDNFGNGRISFDDKMNEYGSKTFRFLALRSQFPDVLKLLIEEPNNIIRNSEAHNKLNIDGLNQVVTFISNNRGKEKIKKLYFVELGKHTIDLFYSILIVWEYYYNFLRWKLIVDGEVPNYVHKTIKSYT